MSSNIRIQKQCEYCKKGYIARKTTSKTCSDNCAKRLYKANQREKKIQAVLLEQQSRKENPQVVIGEQLSMINLKQNLTLKEAAIFLNVSPLTLRRWVFARKVISVKLGRKHLFRKSDLDAILFSN